MAKNEQQQFLEEVAGKQPVDVLEAPITPEPPKAEPPQEPADPAAEPDGLKNRRHRRLEAKNDLLRSEIIQINERLKLVSEAKGTTTQADYLKQVERIYGTDSPEALAATELFKNVLVEAVKDAKNQALDGYRQERQREIAEQRKEEETLDSMIDDLEDEYTVSFTPEMEKAFFKALQKVSPKDADGNVTAYADHRAVWEDLQTKIKKTVNPAKELANRSLTASGAAPTVKLADDATVSFLKDEGII